MTHESLDLTGPAPQVDMVIAVHSEERPIAAAVDSLLDGGLATDRPAGLRITVVCHNIPVTRISARLPEASRTRVRFLELQDGIASPAGPLNHGIARATARYVGVMGSDDTVEPGAISDWLTLAERFRSDAVIAPERHADGRIIRTPVLRAGRHRALHPIKDRLSYRTAPLGLVRRTEIARLSLRFTPGLPTGDDQEFTSKLWFGGGRIDYARGAGRYVVGAQAVDRVSFARRPVPVELEFVRSLVAGEWFQGLSDAERRAIVVKLVRVHVFGLVQTRYESGGWSAADRTELAGVMSALLRRAPGALRPLSLADRRLAKAILDPSLDSEVLRQRALSRRRFGSMATVLPSSLGSALDPESPLRFLPAAALLR
ncbi:glycosyltransferase family 2 protein [uncultured Arthrobacter sp.]|uniref:glycosyltransferase family 2 protein n=1 Tax=uncultured Arthrobacter sp. TaxID=114050 RepID=UPI002607C559|nr:glycosyltransferase family 2 protein [uncultured Arthrobacter sp.]